MAQNLSDAQLRALAIIPHITGSISVVGSTYVLQDILRDPDKRKRTYCRLVFGMAAIDFITSLMYALCTLPMEQGALYGVYAFGNMATCTTQAFLIQMEIASPIYHFYLAWYYLLILKYRWPERKFLAYENKLHAFAMFFSLSTSIALLPLNVYGEFFVWCWITNLEGHGWYQWFFFFGPLWVIIVVSSVLMAKLFLHVRAEETVSRKWRNSVVDARKLGEKKLKKMTGRVFWQAMHYELAFYFTWTIPTISQTILYLAHIQPAFGMQLATSIFTPLAGFFNFTIYIRPRYIKYMEENKKEMWWHVWYRAVKTTVKSRKMKVEIVSVNLDDINLEDLDYDDDEDMTSAPLQVEDDSAKIKASSDDNSNTNNSNNVLDDSRKTDSVFGSLRDPDDPTKYGYEDPAVSAQYGYEDPDGGLKEKQQHGYDDLDASAKYGYEDPDAPPPSNNNAGREKNNNSRLQAGYEDTNKSNASLIGVNRMDSYDKSSSASLSINSLSIDYDEPSSSIIEVKKKPNKNRRLNRQKSQSVIVLNYEENDVGIMDPGAALEPLYDVDQKLKSMKLPKNKKGGMYKLVKKINKGVKKRRKSLLSSVRNLVKGMESSERDASERGVGL